MDIYKRIGEAVASLGKITSVLALNSEESQILHDAGFEFIGTVDINGSIVEIYTVEKTMSEELRKFQQSATEWDEFLTSVYRERNTPPEPISPFDSHHPSNNPRLKTYTPTEYGPSYAINVNDVYNHTWGSK